MGILRTLRTTLGALIYDAPNFVSALYGLGAYRNRPTPWIRVRNRSERLIVSPDATGVRGDWRFTSDIHFTSVFGVAASALMQRAFAEAPIELRDQPLKTGAPDVSFIIGHRGTDRLPQLLLVLRSIAGQRDVAAECVVVEQSVSPEIREVLPAWVRHIHEPVGAGEPYNRSSAFNLGAEAARSELLIFHDNDMVAPARYAADVLTRAGEGWQFLDLKRFIFYLNQADTTNAVTRTNISSDRRCRIVQNAEGGTIAARREAFDAIGKFDEDFVGWGGEDNEFWERATHFGRVYAFGHLPFIHLWHAPQPGKAAQDTEGVRRYHEVRDVAPAERIARLRNRSSR